MGRPADAPASLCVPLPRFLPPQVTIGTFLFHVLSVVLHGMVVFRMLYSLDLWLNMAW